MKSIKHFFIFVLLAFSISVFSQSNQNTQQWKVFETSFESSKSYSNPFMDVQVDVVLEKEDREWKIPAFWDGESTWKVRFAPPETGSYTYRVVSSDQSNKSLKGKKQSLTVTTYKGDNSLYKHGMIGISEDKHH